MNKILLTLLCSVSFVYSNIDFYNQPYVNHTQLGSSGVTVNFNVMAGSTTSSYNGDHKKTALFDMLGIHHLDFLGIQQNGDTLSVLADPINPNAPTATWNILQSMTSSTIEAINAETDLNTYGQLEVSGRLSFKSGAVTVITPSYKGFHAEARLPFSSLNFSNLALTDLSPITENGGFNLQNTSYINVITHLDDILNEYGFTPIKSRTKYTEKDIGDLELDLHYTREIHKTFQAAVQAGIVLPTGKKKNENEVLSTQVATLKK